VSNEYKITSLRVDETQLRLMSRELCHWKMQHDGVNLNDTQLVNIN